MGDICEREICDNISIYPPSSDEHIDNYLRNIEKKNKWQLGKIISKIYNLTTYNNGVDDFYSKMSPYYGADSTKDNIFVHLGPVIGLHYAKSTNLSNTTCGSLIVVNPNSLQRFKDEHKLLQHKSTHPIAITTVSFGSIGGIGKCIFYATQCGKIFVHLSENFEQLLMADTSHYYEDKAVEFTILSVISPVGGYVEYIAAGNIFGHIFLYQVPGMTLMKVLFKGVDDFDLYIPKDLDSDTYTPKALESLYNDDFIKQNEYICNKNFPNTQTDGLFTCAMNVAFKNNLWIAFGDSTLIVLSTPEFTVLHHTSLQVADSKYVATNIQFSRIHEIALVLLGNDYLMVRDICTFNCLRIITSNILTCGFPISTLLLYDTYDYSLSARTCILVVAGMDGSICLRKLERKEGTQFAWTLIKRFVSQKDETNNGDNQVPILCMHLDEFSDSFFLGDARGLVRRYSNFFELYHKDSRSVDIKVKDHAGDG
ncbi:hypothetical protein BMR1_03g01530 [Babesia microti strain RI]|uniref:Uncharacterized protein n=1 Tax=Babesia microti (strain RI) TaxID=1133968 RepID=A0A0K3AR22_BABMR|nr:hypothetical protein BMR1_03g01530 [Babesia microti strain RI]CTQ40905.1 hypothetical protein BMR1_03g01530 [Babesia microti strain RI]|eukprot:XP_012648916.1 hypothetical protein BMR1_03g01530 [Babesia microti strain RI]